MRRNSLRTRKHSVCVEPDQLSRRNSNAVFSALLFREESRAMKTSVMVLSTFLFSWTPLFVHVSVARLPDEVVYSCALSAATLNPLVYVFRNDAFRKEMLRAVCSRKRRMRSSSCSGGAAKTSYQHQRLAAGQRPDSVSVHSFRMSSVECQHSFDSLTPPPPATADFVATYNPVRLARPRLKVGTSHRTASLVLLMSNARVTRWSNVGHVLPNDTNSYHTNPTSWYHW